MRAGLSTIQQTLTAEAASVLNNSIAEAGRRNHGQTTPLHVAATLLASPTGFLRQACIKSHPNSSHPLQCRALELCFSVALERLPTAASAGGGAEPPISNALMAALKRAQAHQRRGCPEQQQQPLLAVKVELEQLIISILDDPSVSRVMREASFSSPAVKATIEQTLNSGNSISNSTNSTAIPSPLTPNSPHQSVVGLGFRTGIGVGVGFGGYQNPRLLNQSGTAGAGAGAGAAPGGGGVQLGQTRGEEVKKVVEILGRGRKRNPVLVGDSEPEAVVKEVLRRIEGKEFGEGALRTAVVVRIGVTAVKEVTGKVQSVIGGGAEAVVLDLGDLKWLVEQPGGAEGGGGGQQVVTEAGREAVAEVGKLVAKFGERLWLIGTATCETYLRCQVYHPSMENDWDLQAVPIAARTPVPGLFPRLGTTSGILSSSVESLSPLKAYQAAKLGPPRRLSENSDPSKKPNCCPQCTQSCEQELAKLAVKESEKPCSDVKQEGNRPPLPQWLQNAKARDDDQGKEQEMVMKQKTDELRKKWSETCLKLHPSFHHPHNFGAERLTLTPKPISLTGLSNPNLLTNPNLLARPPFQPKLQMNKSLGGSLHLNVNPTVQNKPAEKTNSPPGSPVRTDLVLGQTKGNGNGATTQEPSHNNRIKDLFGCIPSEVPSNNNKLIEVLRDDKIASKLDADSFKRLSKGLAEKVWWQPEAAVSMAATMTECRLDSSKQRRGAASKGDMWVLFIGPDRIGKKKMVSALADLVSGSAPVVIPLGSRRGDGDVDVSFRGKTVVDRIVEAVRRNPFSVIMLEDVNEADVLMRGNIKRAMERGRLVDSHGRETSLGNVVFILTADWLPDNLKNVSKGVALDEEKLGRIARKPWQLRLAVKGKSGKRRAHWLDDDQRNSKVRKETSLTLGFDLNEAANIDDNTSDLTIDRDDECGRLNNNRRPTLSAPSPPPSRELLEGVDDTIVFKPAEFPSLRFGIMSTISNRYSKIVGDRIPLEMDEGALEKILSGLWLGKRSLEEWTEGVLVPSFDQLKSTLPGSSSTADESMVVRLESDAESESVDGREDLLPSSVKVVLSDA